MSSIPTDNLFTAWPPVPAISVVRPHRRFFSAGRAERPSSADIGFRFAALQVGYWLGWASIVAVLTGLALDVSVQQRWLLVGATLAAAAGNTAAMVIPWREWLALRQGRLLLDLWCAGLIAFVALLVVNGGSNFALLLFLVVPFIAVVQNGWRRGLWLGVSVATCSVMTALVPLSAGATAMRLALVGAAVAVALILVRTIRRETARAELERIRAQEASHRIKNDLQTAADMLLLGRPEGAGGTAFDETAARIRSIAMVHRLLSETEDRVDGATLLRDITADAPMPVTVEAEPGVFDAATAQKLGLIANELVTNAFQHGAPPIVVRLSHGAETRLCVDDGGCGIVRPAGFGLELVRRMAEQGLDGRFELHAQNGSTRAEVVFPSAR
ncbi:MAG TPA: sensor histidine kinase [Gaiellaceae bacterium]|nr:sensor histidine kinase [Gaiellaceae bacterium]